MLKKLVLGLLVYIACLHFFPAQTKKVMDKTGRAISAAYRQVAH